MKKSTKILIVIVSVILIGVILYFIFKPKKTEYNDIIAPPIKNNGSNNNTPVAKDTFPLKVGSVGENVKRLQMALNRINNVNTITVDGVFGNDTRLKLITTLATSMYSSGPSVTENQLTSIISKSNSI